RARRMAQVPQGGRRRAARRNAVTATRRGVVFYGCTELGFRALEALLDAGVEVRLIVTAGAQFKISYAPGGVTNVLHRDFGALAAARGIACVDATNGMGDPAVRAAVADAGAALSVVIGWYHMIPRAVRALTPTGVVGVHASLLPRYRGGAPLVWAILRGEAETGVTLFHLEDGVDDGDVVAQARFPIAADDTIATVYEKATAATLD